MHIINFQYLFSTLIHFFLIFFQMPLSNAPNPMASSPMTSNVINTMNVMMALPRKSCVPMVWSSIHSTNVICHSMLIVVIVLNCVSIFENCYILSPLLTLILSWDFTEEPISSKFCPRKNGFFAHPDETVCNIFFNCIDGDALETKCTVGLHFDEYSGTCVWPETAKRENCVEKPSKLEK